VFSVNVEFCLNVFFPDTLYGIRFTGHPLENEKRAKHDCQEWETGGVRIKVSISFFAALFCGYLHREVQKLLLLSLSLSLTSVLCQCMFKLTNDVKQSNTRSKV